MPCYTLLWLGVKRIIPVLQYGVMKTSIRIKIGGKIREFRKRRGYTQAKLAELAGIDYKYLQRIEGKKPPALKVDTIEKFAKALKIAPAELFDF